MPTFLGVVVIALVGVGVAAADWVRMDYGCDTKEQHEKANTCRAQCRSVQVAAEKVCQESYTSCVAACPRDEGFRDCRYKCRDTLNACNKTAREAMDSCARACVTDNGCKFVPGTPGS